MKFNNGLAYAISGVMFLASAAILGVACSKKISASDLTAQEVSSGTPGYKCFAIMNGGNPVGGNCVKE
jgi:hypothetical protein